MYCCIHFCIFMHMGKGLITINLRAMGAVHTVLTVRSDEIYKSYTLTIDYLQWNWLNGPIIAIKYSISQLRMTLNDVWYITIEIWS